MNLIPEWRKSLRLYSQQINSVGIALSLTYAGMYEQLKDTIPPRYMAVLTFVVFFAGLICRVISQQPKAEEPQ